MATVSEAERIAPQSAPAAAASSWVVANPSPLGLAGFGVTTFVLSIVNANLVGAPALPVVFGLCIAVGGVAQLLAGMWEFRAGNHFGATIHSLYGGFWISFYFLAHNQLPGLSKSAAAAGVGLYLWAWALITAMLLLCTFTLPRIVPVIFAFLTATFAFLAIGWSGSSSGALHVGGYLGIITAVLALYTCIGILASEVYGRQVFPLG